MTKPSLLTLLGSCLLFGCTLNDLHVTVCKTDVTVSYALQVQPIITTKCSIPNCHNGSNPNLDNWKITENVIANASLISSRVLSREMPPALSKEGDLTTEEIYLIACWVEQGATDN